jgi:two-component system NtrC family sensor kinase
MKLALKITFALTIWTLVILVVNARIRLAYELDVMDEDMQSDLRMIGRTLAPALAEAWRAAGDPRVEEVVQAASASERVVRLRWVDLDAAANAIDAPDLPPEMVSAALTDESVAYGPPPEATRMYAYMALGVPGTERRALELMKPLSSLEAFADRQNRQLVVGLLVIGGCSALVAVLMGWWVVGERVERLVELARRVGRGEDPEAIQDPADDELGTLGREMAAMATALAESREQAEVRRRERENLLTSLRHVDRLATMGALASKVAHEIGTPLSVVSARAKMIARGQLDASAVAENGRIVAEQADRIAAIMRGVLDFSRKKSVRSRLSAERVVSGAVELAAPLANERGVALQVREVTPGCTLQGELLPLEQAVVNLLVNAIHVSPGGSTVEVSLDTSTDPAPPGAGVSGRAWVRIQIRDHGPGIDAETEKTIFDPFFTTKPEGLGTGLGLPITREIIREHGGWIDLVRPPEGGACFRVHLPESPSA